MDILEFETTMRNAAEKDSGAIADLFFFMMENPKQCVEWFSKFVKDERFPITLEMILPVCFGLTTGHLVYDGELEFNQAFHMLMEAGAMIAAGRNYTVSNVVPIREPKVILTNKELNKLLSRLHWSAMAYRFGDDFDKL